MAAGSMPYERHAKAIASAIVTPRAAVAKERRRASRSDFVAWKAPIRRRAAKMSGEASNLNSASTM
jgi:hypothetical protein